jgi:hypothetical protein
MNHKEACLLRSVIETRMRNTSTPQMPDYSYRGQEKRIPSLNSSVGVATAAPMKVYTGTKMLGIATMHKSNSVPVFSQEEAVDISKMRR